MFASVTFWLSGVLLIFQSYLQLLFIFKRTDKKMSVVTSNPAFLLSVNLS